MAVTDLMDELILCQSTNAPKLNWKLLCPPHSSVTQNRVPYPLSSGNRTPRLSCPLFVWIVGVPVSQTPEESEHVEHRLLCTLSGLRAQVFRQAPRGKCIALEVDGVAKICFISEDIPMDSQILNKQLPADSISCGAKILPKTNLYLMRSVLRERTED